MDQTAKTITITIKIPAEYRYMATQPYGDVCLFKEKPVLGFGMTGEEFWTQQVDEISVLGDDRLLAANSCGFEDWKNSVKDLG